MRYRRGVDTPDDATTSHDELIGLSEIAQIIGLSYQRVKYLRWASVNHHTAARPPYYRDVADVGQTRFPEPDGFVAGRPRWWRRTILAYGRRTGRLDSQGQPVRLSPPGRPRAT